MEILENIGFNLPGLISQFINFGLLLVLLTLLLYRPVLRILDQRAERIRESLEAAENARQESARSEEAVQQALREARERSQQIVQQAQELGQRMEADAREGARTEAEALIARAREEIQRERDDAVEQVRHEFADLAILAAERVISRSLDRDAHRGLIEEVLEKSRSGNGGSN